MPKRPSPRNLKAPAKSISPTKRLERSQTAIQALADLKRQAVAPSVLTKSSPWPRCLHIDVPDNDDWYTFCADLLEAGQTRWWAQGDREARHNNNDPSVPRFQTWEEFRKALLQVGERYWEAVGGPSSKAGRPNWFARCWQAYHKEFKAAYSDGRCTIRENDLFPLVNGRPITQGVVQKMIRKGDQGVPKLSDEVCRKYARVLHLSFRLTRPESLSPSDNTFLMKYLPPPFR